MFVVQYTRIQDQSKENWICSNISELKRKRILTRGDLYNTEILARKTVQIYLYNRENKQCVIYTFSQLNAIQQKKHKGKQKVTKDVIDMP